MVVKYWGKPAIGGMVRKIMVCPIDGILRGHSKYLRRLCKNTEKYL
jgi:hypothetical protein